MTDDETLEPTSGDTLPDDPMHWADAWLKEAMATATYSAIRTAMTIVSRSTTNAQPSARVVLCKQFVPEPGYLVFHTNYRSRKALELEHAIRERPHVLHWDSHRPAGSDRRALWCDRPKRKVTTISQSRGWGSQLGAWGSDQSEPIAFQRKPLWTRFVLAGSLAWD